MSPEDLEILQNMMQGGKPPDFAVRLLEDVCERTGLSWKARHVYLQSRKNKTGSSNWQAILSIDGFRAVGARHPDYAGQEGPFFVTSSDGAWTDIPPDGKPYAAKVGIKKRDGLTTWGVAKYGDYYAGMMWDKFPSTMVAKCAEMLAWRKTFPETFGGLYGDAEMAQSEKTQPPSRVLKDLETIGEATPEKEVIAPAELPKHDPSHRLSFKLRLEEATSLETVMGLGREIQAASKDRTLTEMETMELHQLYTKMKAKYAPKK